MTWSSDVGAGDWIATRLAPFASGADAVVPRGFERYVRILHPAGGHGDDPGVRWATVADWAGVPLEPTSTWLDVALPPHPRPSPLPWDGSGPAIGEYPRSVATALTEVLAAHSDPATGTWAATWEGFGDLPELPPVPRLRLPARDYVLRHGTAAEVAWLEVEQPWPGHPPNLWWAADTSWCVATEIDLDHTYVGGRPELIRDLLGDPRLEVQPVDVATASITFCVPAWLAPVVADLARTLLADGSASLELSRGTLTATLRRPGRGRRGELRIDSVGDHHSTHGATTPLDRADDLAEVVRLGVEWAVLSLAT